MHPISLAALVLTPYGLLYFALTSLWGLPGVARSRRAVHASVRRRGRSALNRAFQRFKLTRRRDFRLISRHLVFWNNSALLIFS